MPTRTAEAEWKGNLAQGGGRLKVGSGSKAEEWLMEEAGGQVISQLIAFISKD